MNGIISERQMHVPERMARNARWPWETAPPTSQCSHACSSALYIDSRDSFDSGSDGGEFLDGHRALLISQKSRNAPCLSCSASQSRRSDRTIVCSCSSFLIIKINHRVDLIMHARVTDDWTVAVPQIILSPDLCWMELMSLHPREVRYSCLQSSLNLLQVVVNISKLISLSQH